MPLSFFFFFSPTLLLPWLSYKEEEFIEEKEKRGREKRLLELDRQAVRGAQRYQSQSRLATEILVFQIKQPNLDK